MFLKIKRDKDRIKNANIKCSIYRKSTASQGWDNMLNIRGITFFSVLCYITAIKFNLYNFLRKNPSLNVQLRLFHRVLIDTKVDTSCRLKLSFSLSVVLNYCVSTIAGILRTIFHNECFVLKVRQNWKYIVLLILTKWIYD